MYVEEKCPVCNSEDYEIEDYGDSFDIDGGEQWWQCKCNNGHSFSIHRYYELTNVTIEEE